MTTMCPDFGKARLAIQRLKPLCPDCGREAQMPRIEDVTGRALSLNQMSDCDRTRQHEIACVCGVVFLARFYEQQATRTSGVIPYVATGNQATDAERAVSPAASGEAQKGS